MFMDMNLLKNIINGVNLVKIGIFGENGQNWVILGAKMTSYVKIWGKWSNNFFIKVYKNYFHQVYGKKCGQTCH